MNENFRAATSLLKEETAKSEDVNNQETTTKLKAHKHSSALVAASKGRSAVDHVDPHRLSSLSSNFRATGTNISYEE
jgi:hypothetical protein